MLVHFAADESTKLPAVRATERRRGSVPKRGAEGMTQTCGNEVMWRTGAEVG